MVARELSPFAKSIIEYQEKNHLTDADFSLESHRSVERIHALKTMEAEPTTMSIAKLQQSLMDKSWIKNR